MKAIIVAALFSLGVTGTVSAAGMTDLGGGFAYAPVGSGQCQVLFDAKYGQPIFRTSKREPSRVVVVGTKKECPKEYNGYKITRLAAGQANGFIYTGVTDAGRRLHVYRKIGSNFTFKVGPKPQ
ncbi:hypothetical protein CXZ10_09850 [Pleomorphomonas diazotrophica]|uniref:Uncharacterized protein n=1 Tax=Pleomorphomonas diazotrophica TaxID=1166257 RepID=A0A1I4VK80_9HYPH|nr:hypothetical protein [Pleomorphomonas diazotrophica]PKR89654.1 hypothetical protein CXZ10_09850 [Pleomorphomonas diazotrophica]SFN01642.1 hypothetical protein SAMN05192571_11217 [Pleomorphomonas diazotrophica]